MTSGLLSPSLDERWLSTASPIGRLSLTMSLFVLGSLATHAVLVGTALFTDAAPVLREREIAVEIVQEAPKPAFEVPAPNKPPGIAKSEPLKTEPIKPKPAKSEATPKPPKVESAKIERGSPAKAAAKAPPAQKVDTRAKTLAALERELEALKMEHAALEGERAVAAPRDTGLGPLPDSFQAVALPATSDGVGEAMGYQQVVFSALAKAKGIGKTQGLPGSAGVHFEIDAAGRLVSVEIVHRSGVPSLDAQALAIVRRAAPFPPPPQGARRGFDANVNFVAESG